MKKQIIETIDELWRLWELTENEQAEDILISAIARLEDKLNELNDE